MAARTTAVVLNDGSTDHRFAIAPTQDGGRGWVLQTRQWEPGDPLDRWRIPLHPFDGGLNVDRLYGSPRTYAKGNCDVTYPNMLLFPPLVNSLTGANLSTPTKAVNFDSKVFLIGGRYVYYFNPSDNTLTEDEDLGVGVSAVDAAVFNNELVVACGESTKIFTRNTSGTYTQATDNTYAIALGVVDNRLYRAESTNRISSCTTAPRTLTSWTPASPNQYYAGDSTFAVHTILDYGGIPWCFKADGAYAPDPQSRFKNQTPQLRRAPHADNGKGAFVAQGALWVPSSSGLFRVTSGTSKKRGPELTYRPDFRFWVRGGVEYGDHMYWLCTDESATDATFICKVTRSDNAEARHEYVYQEWARLDGTTKGYFIAATTAGTNPELLAGYGTTGVRWIKLGRGGGRDPDDSAYAFGTSMTLETGTMQVGADLTVPSIFVGVDVLLDYSAAGESLTVSYIADKKRTESSYTDLLDTAEGGGSAAISSTNGYDRVTRYAAAGTQLQTLDVKFAGTLTSATGTSRPTIREAWAHGYSVPKQTDVISLAVHAADNAIVNGSRNGKSREEHLRLFRYWQANGTELTLKIEDYDELQTCRVIVRKVEDSSENITRGNAGMDSTQVSQLRVQLVRVDRASKYASAT